MKGKDDFATDYLVGIDGQVEALMDLLDYDFGGARCLGIHGPGGVGKTTLAKALFDKLISNFDQHCFLRDVRGLSRRNGLVFLQKKLLSDVLGKTEPLVFINDVADGMKATEKGKYFKPQVDISDIDDGLKVIREKLHDKKVLVVLDDVDHREQLEKLIGKISRFGMGSRVVITTRNKSILESGEKITLYEQKEMNYDQALQLYINHAFKGESPRDYNFKRLSMSIVSTIGGLPLIVKVIGSFLHRKHEIVWEETLENLRSIAHEDVHRKLKISHDSLNFKQKQIFLDIACVSFLEEEINASYMWEDCNFFPQTEIEVLNSLSLIHIRENGGLWMHDMLKELGRQIVHEENLDPRKRSRLWISEEAVEMVKTSENKGNIEALSLAGDSTLLIFTDEDFARLPNLRFLELDGGSFIGDFTNLFSKLRWFSWCHYCPELIATNLFPQNLVVLQLSEFNDANDWEGWSQIKMLHNLKVLQLIRPNMVRIDLSGCFTLERLIIEKCPQLVQIDHSIGKLERLAYLNIECCNQLKDLPGEIGLLVNLKHLSLSHCSELKELPDSMGQLNSLIKLDLSLTSIERLPCFVEYLVNLKSLTLARYRKTREPRHLTRNLDSLCKRVPLVRNRESCYPNKNPIKDCSPAKFPSAIGLPIKLEVLRARYCSVAGEVSSEIGKLSFLRILDLSYTDIRRVPETIAMLPHLEELILKNCNELNVLPSLPTSLTHLLVSSMSLKSIPDLSHLTNLINLLLSCGHDYLLLSSSSQSQIHTYNLEWIGKLSKLEHLGLYLPNITVSPTALGSLSRLRKLRMSAHLYPEFLMQPPISAMQENLSPIATFPGLSNLRNLIVLKLCRSMETAIQLGGLEQLRYLIVSGSAILEIIIFSLSGLKNLKELKLEDCPQLRETHGVGALETLESLKVTLCPSITTLGDLSNLQELVELKITSCNELQGFEGLDELGCLSLFKVDCCLSLGFWTNASDTKIPDECQVVIRDCPKIGKTPEGGMFYKDYRDKILGKIKSDSETCTSDSMHKVAKMEEKRQVGSIKIDFGTDNQLNHIMGLMNINDKDKRIIVVIHGEGGIGKTTLAKLIYDQVSCDFDGCSFLADIRETTQVSGGLQLLQTKLISDVLKRELEDVAFVNRGIEFFRDLFCNMRVLIILDDVENAYHVQKLVGDCFDCFASGSRILVTTRNSVVLEDLLRSGLIMLVGWIMIRLFNSLGSMHLCQLLSHI